MEAVGKLVQPYLQNRQIDQCVGSIYEYYENCFNRYSRTPERKLTKIEFTLFVIGTQSFINFINPNPDTAHGVAIAAALSESTLRRKVRWWKKSDDWSHLNAWCEILGGRMIPEVTAQHSLQDGLELAVWVLSCRDPKKWTPVVGFKQVTLTQSVGVS